MRYEPVHRGILCVDIERFSREEWTDPIRSRLRGRLHRLVEQALERAEIDRSLTDRNDLGDGLILLISAEIPVTRLLHPLIAVLAAGLADDNQRAPKAERVRLRAVVHAGEVLPDAQGFSGATVIHAMRLLDAQTGRTILNTVTGTNLALLVSDQVYQSVVVADHPGIDHRSYQPVWVKNKGTGARAWAHLPDQPTQPNLAELASAPVTAHELLAMHAGSGAMRDLLKDEAARPLIGREQERDRLARFAATIAEGPSGPLLIEGPAGMGKTRLIAELWQLAERVGVRPFVVACQEPEVRVGLAPWRTLLATLWPEMLANPAHDPAALGDWVVALFGDDQARAGLAQMGDTRREPDLVSPIVDVLVEAAAARPLLLIFEDAHNLDDRSLALLRAVSARLQGRPVGIVVAIRHSDIDRGGPVDRWRQEVYTAGRLVLGVGPLGRKDVGEWLRQIRRMTPTAEAAHLAWERSAGNPLALRYVSLEPPGHGWDEATSIQLRSEARQPLLSTLKRRSQDCRDWLEAVAVTAVDQRFDPVLVKRVARVSQRLADRCQDEARAAGIVAGGIGWRLAHGLWRDVLLSGLSVARARTLHARAFRVLRERSGQVGGASAERMLPLARHALAGWPRVGAADVVEAVLGAARAAGRRFDDMLAIELCVHGLEVASEPRQRIELLIEHGDAWHRAGDLSKADRSYAEAGDLAARHNEGRLQAIAALRSAYEWWVPLRANPVVQQRLEAALEALTPDVGDLYAQLRAHLARILPLQGPERRRRAELARAGLGELDQIRDPLVAGVVLDGCRSALDDIEPPAALLELSRKLKGLAIRAGFEHFGSTAHMALIVDLVRLGRMQEARREAEDHREFASRSPRPLVTYSQLVVDGMFALWDGRFDAAERHIAGLFGDAPDGGQPVPLGAEAVTRQIAMAQFGWLLRERGQAELLVQQEDVVQEMIRQTGNSPLWHAALALLRAEAGNYRGAADIVTAVAAESGDFTAFPPHGWAVTTLYLIADVCDTVISAEGPEAARLAASRVPKRLRGLLEPHRDEVALGGWPTVLFGPVARGAGLAALVDRDFNAAITLFEHAANYARGSKPSEARLHLDMARSLLGRGRQADLSQVADRLRRAASIADNLGMSHLALRARTLLATL